MASRPARARGEAQVSPVVGHNWYKRPYQLRITGGSRPKRWVAFHWRGARDARAAQLRHWGLAVETRDLGPNTVQR